MRKSFAFRISPTVTIQGLSIIAFIFAWEGISRSGLIFKDLVPPFFTVLRQITILLLSHDFWGHLKISLYEIGMGFLLAALIGVSLGLFLGVRLFWGEVFEPIILYLAATPKIIFFPVCIMLFGLDAGSKVAIGALSGFFPIVISILTGARELNPIYLKVARSFKASPFMTYFKVYFPAILRHLFSGLRLGLGVTVIGTFLGEIKLSRGGLGFMAINFYNQFDLPSMYGIIIVIFALAGLVNALMGIILATFSRYRHTLTT